MKNKNEIFLEFYKLLDLFEDYIKSGFRTDKPVNENLFIEPILEADLQLIDKQRNFAKIEQKINICTFCNLCHNRLNPVSGEGNKKPLVLIVGEAPGAEEDLIGRPFVGAAGQYLNKWLAAIGLERERDCFITNIVKCHPSQNRDPRPEEIEACLPYLDQQIQLLEPKVLLGLGRLAAQTLLQEKKGISSLRERTWYYKKIPLIVTYHPAAVLRDLSLRPLVWADLKKLKALLDKYA